MPSNLSDRGWKFVQVTPAEVTVAAGAAGYLDWDIHLTVGAAVRKCLVLFYAGGVGTNIGVRTKGSSADPKFTGVNGFEYVQIVETDSSGYLQTYRDAAVSNYYKVSGYFI